VLVDLCLSGLNPVSCFHHRGGVSDWFCKKEYVPVPRLSNTDYLKRHRLLHTLWFEHQGTPFSYLSSREQWDLHGYYLPYKDLTDEELLAHRLTITKERPAIPAQAGKAFANLIEGRQTGVMRSFDGKRWISVRAIVKPEIDLKQLSRALLQLAIDQARDQQAKEGATHDHRGRASRAGKGRID